MKKGSRRQVPNLPTVQNIHKLAEYRECHRDQWGRPPAWTTACQAIGINHRTVSRHAPELVKKWEDIEYRW